MRPALDFLCLQSDRRDLSELDKFALNAVHDMKEKVKTFNESILSSEVKEKVVEKLSVTTVSKLFTKNFTEKHLDEYYAELNLNGSEDLLKSALEIRYFFKKVTLDYEGSKSSLNALAQFKTIHYNRFAHELSNDSQPVLKRLANFLNSFLKVIPLMWTFYPWYHAERPRFFNQATLYLDIIRALKFNLAAYIKYVSLLM